MELALGQVLLVQQWHRSVHFRLGRRVEASRCFVFLIRIWAAVCDSGLGHAQRQLGVAARFVVHKFGHDLVGGLQLRRL